MIASPHTLYIAVVPHALPLKN